MARMGFIQDKLEIKFLLLYIASRLIEPVPFEAMQELAMIDDGVDFFDFSECMNDLVTSGHLTLSEDVPFFVILILLHGYFKQKMEKKKLLL